MGCRKRIIATLRSTAGETITEVLVGVLIVGLATVVLATMINVAHAGVAHQHRRAARCL